jgi:hypothetical protein
MESQDYSKLVLFCSHKNLPYILAYLSCFHSSKTYITMSTTTPAAPPHQAPLPSLAGPITRARARDLNFVMLLKNKGPEE